MVSVVYERGWMTRIRKNVLSLAVLSVCLCWPAFGWSADTTAAEPNTTIKMSAEQYRALKTTIEQQETNLTQLSDSLTKQETELATLKKQLNEAQMSLHEARNSSTKAGETLQRQSESLTTLTAQINDMIEEQARIKRQRDTWAIAAGVALYLAVKD